MRECVIREVKRKKAVVCTRERKKLRYLILARRSTVRSSIHSL